MRRFRRATAADAPQLSALALRSKASWGYDADFMQRVQSDFIISNAYVSDWPVFILEDSDRAIGFYGFRIHDGQPFLCDMWLEPLCKGTGLGRLLWSHAVATASDSGYEYFMIESDPNAEGFYRHMGAQRIGAIRSHSSGRMLPLLKFTVAERPAATPPPNA